MSHEYAWLFQFGTQAGDVGARPRACMVSVILLACHESHLRVSPPPPTLSERLQSHLRNFLNSSSLDLASRSKSHNASSLSLGQWQAVHANVLTFCLDTLFAAQHVIERFMLPDLTNSIQRAIDPVR